MAPQEVFLEASLIWMPLIIFASLVIRYMLIAGGAVGLLALFKRSADRGRLQRLPISFQQITRELGWSILSLLIFALAITAVIHLHQAWPILKVYPDFGQHGVIWEFAALAILLLGHDLYFYLAHRLMHAPGIYERVHKVHHLSTNPTPLAAFSFHPLEALIELIGVVLILCVLPISGLMVFIFSLISTALNVMGHLGVETFPRWWLRHPILGLINSATVHNDHHRRFRGNYGLYTLIWDHLFGTLNPPQALRAAKQSNRSGIQTENEPRRADRPHPGSQGAASRPGP